MSQVIAWCSFLGAWLLVAGPIYQAAIDLSDEEFDRDEFARHLANVPRPPRVSRWWLLLPPVAYVLRAHRNRAYQRTMVDVLNTTQLEQVLHFQETAGGWMFVALGGFLLAVPATWKLHEEYHWPTWAFWGLLAVMVLVCVANTSRRIDRRQRLLDAARENP